MRSSPFARFIHKSTNLGGIWCWNQQIFGWFLYVECNPYFTWKSNWSLLFIIRLAYCKNGTWHEIIYLHFFPPKSSSCPLISEAASVWSFVRKTFVPYCLPSLNLLDLLDNTKLEGVKVWRISNVSQCEAQHSGIALSQWPLARPLVRAVVLGNIYA